MKPNLLNDVLCEGSYESFREELLAQIEKEARQKRFARASRWLAAAAAIALLFTLNRPPEPKQSVAIASPIPNPIVIRTVPLKPAQILETHASPQLVINTDRSRNFPSLSDSELLALFPQKPVGLASTTDGRRQFFFLNRADKRRFMSSN